MAIPSVVLTANTTISGTNVANLTITGTVNVDDVVYVFASVFNGAQSITGVSCTGSTNAQIRVPKPAADTPLQAAWATISTGTTNPVFQVTFGGNCNAVVGALVIRGAASPTNPFDPNPSQPATRHDFANDHQGIYSTYTSDTLLIFGGFSNSSGAVTIPGGWSSQINAAGSSRLVVATLGEASPVHSLVATMTGGSNVRSWSDAIAGQAFVPPSNPYAVLSQTRANSSTSSTSITFNGTVNAGDVAYVAVSIFNSGVNITSASCTNSTNASVRLASAGQPLQSAYATFNSITVNPVFTVNFSGTGNVFLMGIVVRGGGSNINPFDSSGSLPVDNNSSTATYTTANSPDLLIFAGHINSNAFDITTPSGWDLLCFPTSVPNLSAIVATLAEATTVSGLTGTMSAGGGSPWALADAITATGTTSPQTQLPRPKARPWRALFGHAPNATRAQRNWFPPQRRRFSTPVVLHAQLPERQSRPWRALFGHAPSAPLAQRNWFPPQRRRFSTPVVLGAQSPERQSRPWRALFGHGPSAALAQRNWFPPQRRRRQPAYPPPNAAQNQMPKRKARPWRDVYGHAPNASLAQRDWFPPQRRRKALAVFIPPQEQIPKRRGRPSRALFGYAPSAPLAQREWFPPQRRRKQVLYPPPNVTHAQLPRRRSRPARPIFGHAPSASLKQRTWFPRQLRRHAFAIIPAPTPIPPIPKRRGRPARALFGHAPNAARAQRAWFPQQRHRYVIAPAPAPIPPIPKRRSRPYRRVWGAAPNAPMALRRWYPHQRRRVVPGTPPSAGPRYLGSVMVST